MADKALGTLNIASPQTDAFRGCVLPVLACLVPCVQRVQSAPGLSTEYQFMAAMRLGWPTCRGGLDPVPKCERIAWGWTCRRAQELVAFAAVLAPIIGLQRFRKELKVRTPAALLTRVAQDNVTLWRRNGAQPPMGEC